ncbi:MAG: small subunit ribosomal protein S3 [Candidatus Berkelbacteria bacterium Gr01-1014_85]|uniref:Small ribosomal subunit protein uS3 n=1 Tax=Candidatus Berkelbacteria bacterium Gr01-1014_85 TaxID=2017150 RepID=A0A554JD61_9BACT|nr:MAG: small subunit ribosomal protein S3 [Candidatus Berkelbacteria bacterium Gr01-1014_85]
MGQKVNPFVMRLGINKNWQSNWFPPKGNFAAYLLVDQKIRQAIASSYNTDSAIGSVQIKRGVDQLTVIIETAKPGVIIGRAGAGVEALKQKIQKILGSGIKLKVDIHEIKNGDLYAAVVAQNIAGQIERRISYRRASKQALERTMGRGALGIKIRISGRLGGAEIARSEKFSLGSVPLSTFRADIDYAQVHAKTTYGIVGVKVWIYKGEKTEVDQN